MKLETVGPLELIPKQDSYFFSNGVYQIVLFRSGDEVYALDDTCPHASASLSKGYTDGKIVVCPWHCWEFDCKTGQGISVKGIDAEVFKVVIEDGIVKVELPE
ncbi:Rieske (2Fe-2S) protein [bacterium]|nr:MAG: Rieske (2Fe-2S) protein [bacterium]